MADILGRWVLWNKYTYGPFSLYGDKYGPSSTNAHKDRTGAAGVGWLCGLFYMYNVGHTDRKAGGRAERAPELLKPESVDSGFHFHQTFHTSSSFLIN